MGHPSNDTINMHSNYIVKVHAVCLCGRCVECKYKYSSSSSLQGHSSSGGGGVNLVMAKQGQF